MARVVSSETIEWLRFPEGGPASAGENRAANLLGDRDSYERGPQAFVFDVYGESKGHPHFHDVDQFQIFVRGSARIGKHEAPPVTVHYTDAFTPYGPLMTGPSGMQMFNLRPRSSVGTFPMPGSSDGMRRRAGRHRVAHWDVGSPSAPLIEREEDGLFAAGTKLEPGAPLEEELAGGSGRYELVLEGSLELAGRTLPPHSVIFTEAGERVPPATAGSGGAHVLTVQAPTD